MNWLINSKVRIGVNPDPFIAGKLEYNPDAYCDHHGEDHKCGKYNCVK